MKRNHNCTIGNALELLGQRGGLIGLIVSCGLLHLPLYAPGFRKQEYIFFKVSADQFFEF